MEEMSSFWDYKEHSILELKHTLLCTMFELESARTEAKEEMTRNEENVNHLLELLKMACQERDEARNQLQTLLNKVVQPESPLNSTKAHSSNVTRLDNPSETYKYHSTGYSPVDCYFNPISSSILSNSGLIFTSNTGRQKQPLVQEYSGGISIGDASSSAVIDNLVKGKPLPQKGKLLQAVIEAGPLLQTLLFAGPPLPRWQKPPTPLSLPIPYFPHKEADHGSLRHNIATNSDGKFSNSLCSSNHDVSRGFSHIPCRSKMNFAFPLSNITNCSSLCNEVMAGKGRRCQ